MRGRRLRHPTRELMPKAPVRMSRTDAAQQAAFSMLICRACSRSGRALSTPIFALKFHILVLPAQSSKPPIITARSAPIAPIG